MISLPKIKKNSEEAAEQCKCRPVCKNRRREWKGEIQKTSAELRLERKPLSDCVKRWPSKVFPNGPCPLFERYHHISINRRSAIDEQDAVRICQAPLDDRVDTTYLKYTNLARRLGALDALKSCRVLDCASRCACACQDHAEHDAERSDRRRVDMREFDRRVKSTYHYMRIMYN